MSTNVFWVFMFLASCASSGCSIDYLIYVCDTFKLTKYEILSFMFVHTLVSFIVWTFISKSILALLVILIGSLLINLGFYTLWLWYTREYVSQ